MQAVEYYHILVKKKKKNIKFGWLYRTGSCRVYFCGLVDQITLAP